MVNKRQVVRKRSCLPLSIKSEFGDLEFRSLQWGVELHVLCHSNPPDDYVLYWHCFLKHKYNPPSFVFSPVIPRTNNYSITWNTIQYDDYLRYQYLCNATTDGWYHSYEIFCLSVYMNRVWNGWSLLMTFMGTCQNFKLISYEVHM